MSIIRMDVDTTGAKASHQTLLSRFDEEKIDVLLGTQMVSKGLDFPNVTLVGVLAADQSLGIDDFRANERTFNLITQVCGRAGRGKKQTLSADAENSQPAAYEEEYTEDTEEDPPAEEYDTEDFDPDEYDTDDIEEGLFSGI